MANQKGGREGFLHLVQQPLEKLMQKYGAQLALSMPALRLGIFYARRAAGHEKFAAGLEHGLSFLRALGVGFRWRGTPLTGAVNNFVWEIVSELGASLAEWSKNTSADEVEELIVEEEAQGPLPAGDRAWLGEMPEMVHAIIARLPTLNDILPLPDTEPEEARNELFALAKRIRAAARKL